MPANKYDRNTFSGSMNFLINLILEDNPKAKIVFIGHYENDRKTRISIAQMNLAEYWNYPLFQGWERFGFSQEKVKTTAYWKEGYWVEDGGEEQTLTLTQMWMPDDLHPGSDRSGRCNKHIADEIHKWIISCFNLE